MSVLSQLHIPFSEHALRYLDDLRGLLNANIKGLNVAGERVPEDRAAEERWVAFMTRQVRMYGPQVVGMRHPIGPELPRKEWEELLKHVEDGLPKVTGHLVVGSSRAERGGHGLRSFTALPERRKLAVLRYMAAEYFGLLDHVGWNKRALLFNPVLHQGTRQAEQLMRHPSGQFLSPSLRATAIVESPKDPLAALGRTGDAAKKIAEDPDFSEFTLSEIAYVVAKRPKRNPREHLREAAALLRQWREDPKISGLGETALRYGAIRFVDKNGKRDLFIGRCLQFGPDAVIKAKVQLGE